MGKKSRSKGLFKPPKHKHLAKIVTFKSPKAAKKAASELVREAKKAKRIDAVKRRALAAQYAANRARASAKRRNLSPKERKELREIADVYKEAAEEIWEIYHEKYGED